MKKIALLTALFLAVATLASAGTSISIDLTDKTTTGKTVYGASSGSASTSTPLIGKTSTGVGIGLLTGAKGYALCTQHMSGTKEFGSSYDSTSIFAKMTTVGTIVLAVPTATDTSDFTAWDKL